MNIRHLFLFPLLVCFVIFTSCSNEELASKHFTSKILEEQNILDISYGNNSQQKFDLYLPANRDINSTKTLILVHGGAWIQGDKEDMNYLIPILKQQFPTYAIANINYRLADIENHAFPMQLDDLNAVIVKLKKENYGISNQYGFIGSSAGAHLSMLYSYNYNTKKEIKMVASVVGPTNLTDLNYTTNEQWLRYYYPLTGVNYEGNEEYFKSLSPYHTATSSSPPTILFYGNNDPLIPVTQGQDMHLKLNELGVYNEFTIYEGGHGTWSQNDIIDSYNKLVRFIKNKF